MAISGAGEGRKGQVFGEGVGGGVSVVQLL